LGWDVIYLDRSSGLEVVALLTDSHGLATGASKPEEHEPRTVPIFVLFVSSWFKDYRGALPPSRYALRRTRRVATYFASGVTGNRSGMSGPSCLGG
jgi:hypothetical protein